MSKIVKLGMVLFIITAITGLFWVVCTQALEPIQKIKQRERSKL